MLSSPVSEEDEIDTLLANACAAELVSFPRGVGILPMSTHPPLNTVFVQNPRAGRPCHIITNLAAEVVKGE